MVDAAYDLEPAPQAWLAAVTRAVDRLVGNGGRAVGLEFDASRAGSAVSRVAAPGLGAEERWVHAALQAPPLDRLLRALVGPIDAFPALTHLSDRARDFATTRHVFGPFAQRFGFADLVAASAHDGSGRGVLVNLQVDREGERIERRAALLHVLPHVSAGLRLRRALETLGASERPLGAEVMLDAAGIVREGEAASSDRERLRDAVVARERARLRGAEEDAIAGWTALVDGRWSLVDHFERAGRRYVVAIPNPPDVRAPRRLTEMERAVLALVLLGRSNKAVAYELGIGVGTVSAHLRAGRRKLGPLAALARGAAHRELFRARVGTLDLAAFVDAPDGQRTERLALLTPSERAVVRLALDGLSNAEIARARGVAERTIANQLAMAYRKLDVGSRRELGAKLGSA